MKKRKKVPYSWNCERKKQEAAGMQGENNHKIASCSRTQKKSGVKPKEQTFPWEEGITTTDAKWSFKHQEEARGDRRQRAETSGESVIVGENGVKRDWSNMGWEKKKYGGGGGTMAKKISRTQVAQTPTFKTKT